MDNMMKALVKAKPEEGLWMERVPVPEPGPTEVLIKVKKSAICGTDVHIWNWDEWSAGSCPCPWSWAMSSWARSSNWARRSPITTSVSVSRARVT